MIRHSVIFSLNQPPSSTQHAAFFKAAHELSAIPGVRQFEILKQVSDKNAYEYGIAMAFEDENQYAAYNTHPDHRQFLENFWIPYVKEFLEIDLVGLEG
jgi:heme-degrading monooxygenase HmoA